MEEWKKAFKVINGKTPTKKDCELAPTVLKEAALPTKRTLFASPKKVGSLLKRPPSNVYVSPAKKRKLLDRASVSLEPPKENLEPTRKSPRKTATTPLKEANIFSPLKGWSAYQGTPQKTPQKNVSFAVDPKSPSPKKRTPNSAIRNIKFLLDVKTPEKKELKEEDTEDLFPEFEDEKPDAPRLTDSKKPRKKSDKNFIKLNMRKKTFDINNHNISGVVKSLLDNQSDVEIHNYPLGSDICKEFTKKLSDSHQKLILLVDEKRIEDRQNACNYIAYQDSPTALQILHSGFEGNSFVCVILTSPAGQINYEIYTVEFEKLAKSVIDLALHDAENTVLNPLTPPKPVEISENMMKKITKAKQFAAENEGKTPISTYQFWFGWIVIVVGIVLGILTIDNRAFADYEVKELKLE